MGTKRSGIIVIALIFGLCAALVPFAVGYSPDCSEPPFIKAGAKSNLLFILDNSGSMAEFAFQESTAQVRSAPPPDPSTLTLPWSSRPCASTCTGIGQDCTGSADCSTWPYYRTWTGSNKCGTCSGSGTGSCNTGDCDGAVTTDPGTQKCYQKMCWSSADPAWVDNGAGTPPSWQGGYCERAFYCKRVCRSQQRCQTDGSTCRLRLFDGAYPQCRMADGSSMPDYVSFDCSSSSQCVLNYDPPAGVGGISSTAYAGYDPARTYYGLFDSDKLYKYNHSSGQHLFYTEDTWNAVKFIPSGKTYTVRAACRTTETCDKFSGNWLNWLTMRRIDIAKKVLTGGRLGGDTANWVLVGTPPDRSWWKAFNDNGTDGVYYTPFKQPVVIYFSTQDPGGGRTPSATKLTTPTVKRWPQGKFVPLFTIFPAYIESGRYMVNDIALSLDTQYQNAGETQSGREYDGSYYLAVKYAGVASTAAADTPPTGVVQNFADKVRFGFMHFNQGVGPADGYSLSSTSIDTWDIDGDGTTDFREGRGDGGRIINYLGDLNMADLTQTRSAVPTLVQAYDVVFNINEAVPTTWTPLAEVLREAMNYLKQADSCYAWVDGNGALQPNFIKDAAHDPFAGIESCTRTYLIMVSDGEATQDAPCKCGCKTLNSSSCSSSDCAPITRSFRFNGSGYLDDIAYIMHTEDLRTDVGSGACTVVKNTSGSCSGDTSGYSVAADFPDTCQTATLYTIFTFETSLSAQDALARAGLAGGFTDNNKDNEPGCTGSGVTDWRCAYLSPTYTGCDTSHAPSGWVGYTEWDGTVPPAQQPDHFFLASQDTIGATLEGYLASIFSQIALGGSAGAVPTISQETAEGDVIVRGAFDAADPANRARYLWNGHLEVYWPGGTECKYEFDYSTNTGLFCEQITDGHCGTSLTGCSACSDGRSCWDAGKKLQDRTTARTIYTMIDGEQKAFDLLTAAAASTGDPLRILMRDSSTGALPDIDTMQAVIQWVRGVMDTTGQYPLDDSGDYIPAGSTPGDASNPSKGPFRDRQGRKLGDIVYSTPVIVGPPSLGGVFGVDPDVADFWSYRYDHRERQKVAYVGANDGMIHAIRLARRVEVTDADGVTSSTWCYNCDDCGEEIWAFIPSNFLGELATLAGTGYGSGSCKHRTMVDLSPKAWDVRLTKRTGFTNADGTTAQTEGCSADSSCTNDQCWRTVIVGGERGGGDVYFAIDVTNPENPIVLWEYSVLKNLAVVYDSGAEFRMALPFKSHDVNADGDLDDDDVYFKLKTMPMTWSEPAIGRLKFPVNDVGFWRYIGGELAPSQTTTTAATAAALNQKMFTGCDNKRHMVFIGGGFRLFEPTPARLGTTPAPDDSSDMVEKALTRPNFMAIDVETGENYFQVIWPILNRARLPFGTSENLLPDKYIPSTSTTNLIPWAMAGATAIDVWDNDLDGVGEDGFVDTIYVGDLRGYLYRIRFQLKDAATSFRKGINVNFRVTKPIPALATPTDPATCDESNVYRDCRQPITVPPAVAWDSSTVGSSTPSLRVVFGTGKFDDVRGTLGHDKSDQAQMAFYNLKDLVAGKDPTTETGWYFVKDPVTGASTISMTNSCTVVPKVDASGYDTVTGLTADHASGFVLGENNFVVQFGVQTGAALGVAECTPDLYNKYGCTFTTTSCDAVTRQACEDSCDTTCAARAKRFCGSAATSGLGACAGSASTTDTAACIAAYKTECATACKVPCSSSECEVIERTDCCDWAETVTCNPDLEKCTEIKKSETESVFIKTQGICCEDDCTASCWSCIYDFASPAERVIGKAVISGGLVFFTTFAPEDADCSAGGRGWLYVLNYRCQAFEDGLFPVVAAGGHAVSSLTTTGSTPQLFGVKVDLGSGMPSRPVLDSKGENVIIQKSDATLIKLGVSTSNTGRVTFQGWKTETGK